MMLSRPTVHPLGRTVTGQQGIFSLFTLHSHGRSEARAQVIQAGFDDGRREDCFHLSGRSNSVSDHNTRYFAYQQDVCLDSYSLVILGWSFL